MRSISSSVIWSAVMKFTFAVCSSGGKVSVKGALKRRQMDTGATERYMHAVEPELWEVAQRLEAELGELRKSEEMARVGGVKSCVSGVKNGVNLDAVGCSQLPRDVGKSRSLDTERCPSGRRGTPGERVYPKGTVGSNPTLSASFAAAAWLAASATGPALQDVLTSR